MRATGHIVAALGFGASASRRLTKARMREAKFFRWLHGKMRKRAPFTTRCRPEAGPLDDLLCHSITCRIAVVRSTGALVRNLGWQRCAAVAIPPRVAFRRLRANRNAIRLHDPESSAQVLM